jgi:UDP-N-acetylglucosamine 2-epimerase (non-hydrolysing)
MKFDLIAGARPNFVKIAPLIKVLDNTKVAYRLVHTGQHYDENMSQSFFDQLGIPSPQINLGGGGGTQAEQTAKIMIGYERLLMEAPSDLCIVVGDVTSTMACSIVAKKLGIKVAHIEGGIRSGDLTMPEEINRIVTDSITDYFFTTSEVANDNLRKAGVEDSRIFFVGNTMIDSLLANQDRLQKPNFWNDYNLSPQSYLVLTLHRPSNVDEEENLVNLLNAILDSSGDFQLIFPAHPRTRKNLKELENRYPRLIITEPLPYLQFNYIVKNSFGVITDSGGITEETTVMGIPCMTLRDNTERPETITMGTNELLGANPESIKPAMEKLLSGNWKKGKIPLLWDGKTSERIVQVLLKYV